MHEDKRVRRLSDKSSWVHVPCPWCKDPSAHLGIKMDPKGNPYGSSRDRGNPAFKCLRCGASSKKNYRLPSHLLDSIRPVGTTHKGPWFVDGGDAGCAAPLSQPTGIDSLPSVNTRYHKHSPPKSVSPTFTSSWWHPVAEWFKAKWPALSWDHAVAQGMTVPLGKWDQLLFPYDTDEGIGYILKRRDKHPLSYGPAGPGWIPGRSKSGHLAVVEGVTDALAIPRGYGVLVLLGSSNEITPAILKDVSCLYLALDNDEAGQRGTRAIARQCLKQGLPVRLCALPDGKDPGDLGRHRMQQRLSEARRIEGINDLA